MGEKKKNDNGGGGSKGTVTVVFKADLDCEGCATKVIKCIRSFDGVDTATISEGQKITVIGKVDPAKLREKVEQKTRKNIELISPAPKKEANNGGDNKENKNGGDNQKQEKKNESKEKNSKDKPDEKKSKEKEIPVTTAVLKVNLHCEGCIQKIYKNVTKTKGYQDMKIDRQKELVTVTGAMDMKDLAEMLKKHLKRNVEIVPPKKEVEKKEGGGSGGGDKKKGGGGGDGGEAAGGRGEKMESNKMQYQVGYPYPFTNGLGPGGDQFHYNSYPVGPVHAPQLFSDENPNACSVM